MTKIYMWHQRYEKIFGWNSLISILTEKWFLVFLDFFFLERRKHDAWVFFIRNHIFCFCFLILFKSKRRNLFFSHLYFWGMNWKHSIDMEIWNMVELSNPVRGIIHVLSLANWGSVWLGVIRIIFFCLPFLSYQHKIW